MCPFCGVNGAYEEMRCHTCMATFAICKGCIGTWQPCGRCEQPHCRPHMKFEGLCLVCWSLVEGYAQRRQGMLQILRRSTTQVATLARDPFADAEGVVPYVPPIPMVTEQPAVRVWLKLGDLAPCERLFFAYDPSLNQSSVYELLEACRGYGAVLELPEDVSADLSACSTETSFVQLVPVQAPQADFIFLQDQFIIGGSFAPEQSLWSPVALRCRRKLKGNLADWVANTLPLIPLEPPLEVDDRLLAGEGDDQNGVEFGGNFLLSPPVKGGTDELPAGPAGPKLPQHPPAPYGKLIIGDARHPEKPCTTPAAGMAGHSVSSTTRKALCEHTLQPVIPIDTSWLLVAHVDEIISFAQGPDGPCLSVASPDLMLRLLELLDKCWPELGTLTCFHVGQFKRREDYLEQTPGDLLARKAFNLDIHKSAIAPIVDRLQRTTGVATVIELPVLFEPSVPGKPIHQTKAHALTVDLVNMIVFPEGVIVPRPYGPRLPYEHAAQIVRTLIGEPKILPETLPFRYWTDPVETLLRVAGYFAPCPPEHHDARRQALVLNTGTAWLDSKPVVELARQIAALNRIAQDDLRKPLGRRRLVIPLPHVDVVEWLVAERYAAHGIKCQFADDWAYHINFGELHCGSNSVRKPPADWPAIDPQLAHSCLYDETTAAPPLPTGPVEFKNGEKVIVRYQDQDVPGVVLMNRKPQDPDNNIYVKLNGSMTATEVPRTTVRRPE